MYKHFNDYYWKMGKPYGRKIVDPHSSETSYKIVVDPYYKRFTIEKYIYFTFEKIVYDSALLDFRHLTLGEQIAWRRELLQETDNQEITLLRNQDDRAVFIETLTFIDQHCRHCQTKSTLGIPLAEHRMYYQFMDDFFNGVVLYDMEQRPVMIKTYEIDTNTQEFTNLILEEWNIEILPKELSLLGTKTYAKH